MKEAPTFDEYRTGYISERWNVSDNCAKALQLFELGFSTSGASKHLPVTESTVKGYHQELMDKIHQNIVFSLAGSGRDGQFDVWGKRDVSDYKSFNYADGVAHAQEAKDTPATDRQSQIDPEFRDREKPLNRGVPLSEIDDSLITIKS